MRQFFGRTPSMHMRSGCMFARIRRSLFRFPATFIANGELSDLFANFSMGLIPKFALIKLIKLSL